MARLADPAVPGDQKITLIEQGTPDEAAGLDRFAIALRDNAALPLTFEARDLAWSQAVPGNVVTTMVIKQANPQGSEFRYPMEFAPSDGSWQLTRQTADLLLELDTATGEVLRELAPGFASGHLKPFPIKPSAIYPLEQAKAAFVAVAGSSRDRVILRP